MSDEREEILSEIADLDTTDVNSTIEYQVWVIGYDNNEVTDYTYQIDTFDTGVEAIKCAKYFSEYKNIQPLLAWEFLDDTDELEVTVEQVVFDEDNEEIDTTILYSCFVSPDNI